MKLIFEITLEQFDQYRKLVKKEIHTDFYTKSNLRTRVLSPNGSKPKTVKAYQNALAKVADYNLHSILMENGKIKIIRGFLKDKEKEIYSYSSHGGNTFGVYLKDNKAFLFYIGAVSQVIRLPFLQELVEQKAKPVVFERDDHASKSRWYSLGLIPQMIDKKKAITYFKQKDLSESLGYAEQFVWDRWLQEPDFLPAIIAK